MRGDLRHQKGLTLVELMVVLLLLSLITLGLFGGLRLGARAWEAGQKVSAALDDVVLIQGFLRRQLGQDIEGRAETARRRRGQGLEGGRETLVFNAPWLTDLAQGSIFRFELSFRDEALHLAWAPQEAAEDSDSDDLGDLIGERVLLTGVGEARVRYIGHRDRASPPEWLDEWQSKEWQPLLVELDVRFSEGGFRRWPLFRVRVSE